MKKYIILFIIFSLSTSVEGLDYVPNDYIWTFAYTRDSKYIATAEVGGNICIYDSINLELIKTLQGHDYQNTSRYLEFSPDGLYIASCSHDILIFNLETEDIIFNSDPKSYVITSISYRFDGQRIVSGSANGIITIYDIINGKEIMTLDNSPREVIKAISYSPDGSKIIAAFENCFKIWDANNGREIMTIYEQNMYLNTASFSPDGTKIIANYSNSLWRGGDGSNIIKIYDSNNYEILYSNIIRNRDIRNAFFIPNSDYIIYLHDGYLLIVMDYKNGNIIHEFPQGNRFVLSRFFIAIGYNGENIIYTENGYDIKIWKLY